MLHLLPLSELTAQRRSHPDTLTAASLDDAGFIHCSPDEATTLAVANFLYADTTEQLVALDLESARLTSRVVHEAADPTPPPGVPAETTFPHVYGPINTDAITGFRYARRDLTGAYVSLDRRGATADRLGLLPHPEGGWFRETWLAPTSFQPEGYPSSRPSATGILFLLHADERNIWHRVRSDELWLWHGSGPLTIRFGGNGDRPVEQSTAVLGMDLAAGEHPQVLVAGDEWQCAEPAGDSEVLVSCIVSPGFDFADFEG